MPVQINATALAARSFLAFRQRVILEISGIIHKHGAQPAYNYYGYVTNINVDSAREAAKQAEHSFDEALI